MYSKVLKLLFVTTAYAPIILIWWLVNLYNILKTGNHIQWIRFADFKILDLWNKTNLIFLFCLLVIFCWFFLYLAKTRLTRNKIEIKAIKSADLNMNLLIISYFLPCIEIYKKDNFYILAWIIALLIMILINKSTYFYNPLMKLFGYRYYEITTKKEVTYMMISKCKLINSNDITAYSHLTDYVILNSSK
jgi:hypothetical protein